MSVTHTKHAQYYARSATLSRYRASKLGSRPKNFPAAHYTSAATTSYWPPLTFVCSPLEHRKFRSTYLSHLVSRYLRWYYISSKLRVLSHLESHKNTVIANSITERWNTYSKEGVQCGLYLILKTTESLTACIYMEMGCYYGLELRFTNFSYRKQSIMLVLFSFKISPNFTYRT
jgi:hypothetical protein